MPLHNDSKFSIYFGDDSESVRLQQGKFKESLKSDLSKLQGKLNTKSFVFIKQVHGTNGVIISREYKLRQPIDVPSVHGDIILTDRKDVGIGVLTADCLPVVFYDRVYHALAIIHAGWRGSISGVVQRSVKMMHDRFKSEPKDLEVHFGPAAKSCCYEVQEDFLKRLSKTDFDHEHSIICKNDKVFFDTAEFNKSLLIDLGIKKKNIKQDHHECTICNINYCSYRRDGDGANRQVTIAMLK